MSHFAVLVIGNDSGKQLAPFQENNMGECLKKFMKFVVYVNDERQYFNSEEEAKLTLKNAFNPEETYWENPNAKWDWYEIGGRWTGAFKLKPDRFGGVGELGRMIPRAFPGFADSALKGDIDFAGMRKEAADKAVIEWEKAKMIMDDSLSLEKMREEIHKGDIDAAREAYVKSAENSAITFFAVLKDGEWYERGKRGWWACVSDEKDQDKWNEEVTALLDSIPDDTLLTMVDCHI